MKILLGPLAKRSRRVSALWVGGGPLAMLATTLSVLECCRVLVWAVGK